MEHGFKVLRGKITIKGFYTPMLLLLRRCKVVSHFHLASSTFYIGGKRIYKRYGSIIEPCGVSRCGNLEKKVANNVSISSNYYQDLTFQKLKY